MIVRIVTGLKLQLARYLIVALVDFYTDQGCLLRRIFLVLFDIEYRAIDLHLSLNHHFRAPG